MGCDKRIATVSRAEFDQLMAIVRAPPEECRPLTDEDHWRRAYRAQQERRRVIGYQPDLFAARPITRYHRHRPAPSWDRTPEETIAEKLDRIAGDPFATFGPPRADRPAHLTPMQKAEIVAKAANWLRVGQRVRLSAARYPTGDLHGLERVWSRADLGTLIVEATNRQTLLGLGRDTPRAKGPALDPRRLPDDRLDHLIQSHRNIDIVNALRGERERRARAATLLDCRQQQ